MRAGRSLLVVALALGCRVDRDGDGFVGRDDCDDRDAAIFPGAVERCDGVDQDCDGAIDEPEGLAPRYRDADGDGVGDDDTIVQECPAPVGTVAVGGDCDDGRADVFPGAPEACDGVDQDCDGEVDEDPTPPLFVDDDADGFGDPARPVGCVPFAVLDGGDCDDGDDAVYPGAVERCNGVDDDCDGVVVGEEDVDEDGAPACADCDDLDPLRSPGLLERCSGIDDDCDGTIDGPNAWWGDSPVRVPVQILAEAGSVAPATFDLDARAVLDAAGLVVAFDPSQLRAVWQDCGEGLIELPVAFLDHGEGLAQGLESPIGDEVGGIVVLFDTDGDLETVEPWPGPVDVALYLQAGPAPDWTSDLVASTASIRTADHELTMVAERGGLASWSDEAGPLWSQAEATRGNGVRTALGPLSAMDVYGVSALDDGGPITAAVTSTSTVSDGAGSVDLSWTYRRFAGRQEMWVRTSIVARATTTVTGLTDRTEPVRPWQIVVNNPALGDSVTASADLQTVSVQASSRPVGWSWLSPPNYLTHVPVTLDEGEVWASGNDLWPCCDAASGTVAAGAALVDRAVLRVGSLLTSVPDVVVGDPEPADPDSMR